MTITDFASRYLIACEASHTTKEGYAFVVFESAFKEFGLRRATYLTPERILMGVVDGGWANGGPWAN